MGKAINSVQVGSYEGNRARIRIVEFEGTRLASRTQYWDDDTSRGTAETLYRTNDGGLLLYVEEWSDWPEETSRYRLLEIAEQDLRPGGQFELLGRWAASSCSSGV